MKGNFAVAGWYTNIVPGCSVLPLVEINAAKIDFPFGGTLHVTPEGDINGTIVDSTGKAEVSGKVVDTKVELHKQYSEGEMAEQPPVFYTMSIEAEGGGDAFVLKGNFRFSEDQQSNNGEVVMFMHQNIIPLEPREGCCGESD